MLRVVETPYAQRQVRHLCMCDARRPPARCTACMLTGPARPHVRCVLRMSLPALAPDACRAYIQGPLPPPSELHICLRLQDSPTPSRCVPVPHMCMPAPATGAYICVRPAALI